MEIGLVNFIVIHQRIGKAEVAIGESGGGKKERFGDIAARGKDQNVRKSK